MASSLPPYKGSRWQTSDRKTVYDNQWIRVEHHEVIAPTGAEAIYGVVHMHNTAVGIIPIDEYGFTWLVGQLRYPLDSYSWEIPMGGVKGIDPAALLAGAARELAEETGLSAATYTELLRAHTTNCVADELGVVYLAEGLTAGEQSPDPTEQLDVRKLPFSEAWRLVMSGAITDALSVAAILKAAALNPELLKQSY